MQQQQTDELYLDQLPDPLSPQILLSNGTITSDDLRNTVMSEEIRDTSRLNDDQTPPTAAESTTEIIDSDESDRVTGHNDVSSPQSLDQQLDQQLEHPLDQPLVESDERDRDSMHERKAANVISMASDGKSTATDPSDLVVVSEHIKASIFQEDSSAGVSVDARHAGDTSNISTDSSTQTSGEGTPFNVPQQFELLTSVVSWLFSTSVAAAANRLVTLLPLDISLSGRASREGGPDKQIDSPIFCSMPLYQCVSSCVSPSVDRTREALNHVGTVMGNMTQRCLERAGVNEVVRDACGSIEIIFYQLRNWDYREFILHIRETDFRELIKEMRSIAAVQELMCRLIPGLEYRLTQAKERFSSFTTNYVPAKILQAENRVKCIIKKPVCYLRHAFDSAWIYLRFIQDSVKTLVSDHLKRLINAFVKPRWDEEILQHVASMLSLIPDSITRLLDRAISKSSAAIGRDPSEVDPNTIFAIACETFVACHSRPGQVSVSDFQETLKTRLQSVAGLKIQTSEASNGIESNLEDQQSRDQIKHVVINS